MIETVKATLERHFDHPIVIARYRGLDNEPITYSVECEECFEVLFDSEVLDDVNTFYSESVKNV